ncbi:MAG: hypothetical protein QE493_07670 [Verrucomicrobiae bacterium]|nr:hypothetical protein [Verrucomicrobiae bacterium]
MESSIVTALVSNGDLDGMYSYSLASHSFARLLLIKLCAAPHDI